MFFSPLGTLMLATRGELMPGTWLPFLYGLLVIVACYCIIELNDRWLHFCISKLRGHRRVVAFSAIWLLTLAISLYAYPRIEVFATFWNDYLM